MAYQNKTYRGLPALSDARTKRTFFPDVRFRATVFSHDNGPIELATLRNESPTGRASSDLVQVDVNKNIGSPQGTWSMTLIPRWDYFKVVRPGDWCRIESDNGDGVGWRPLMYGPVTTVRRQRQVGERGITQSFYQIQGCDFARAVANTSALFDDTLARDPAFSNLGIAAVAQQTQAAIGPPDVVVKWLLERFLAPTLEQWIDPDSRQPLGAILKLEYIASNLIGRAVPTPINLQGSLWQFLQQWSNPTVNEMFMDLRSPFANQSDKVNLVPAFILRQFPFAGDDWNNLDAIALQADEVISEDIGCDSGDVKNWIRALDDSGVLGLRNGLAVYTDKIGVYSTESIKRFGFCRLEGPTQYIIGTETSERQTIPGIVEAHSGLQALWNHSNEKLKTGTFVTYHRPDVRVGYRLDYLNSDADERWQFYVEGVSHSLTYPGRSTTTLSVTRGRDLNDPTTQALFAYSLTELKANGVLQDLAGTIEKSVRALNSIPTLRGES